MNKKMRQTLTLTAILVCWACDSEQQHVTVSPFGEPAQTSALTAEAFRTYGEEMFDDDESFDEMTSSDRWFYLNDPFYARIENAEMEVANFVAHDFNDVDICMTMPQLNDTIILMHLDRVPGYYKSRIPSPLSSEDMLLATRSGKTVRLTNAHLLSSSEYKVFPVCDDPVFANVRKITMKTRIKWRVSNSGNWRPLTPEITRYFAAMMLNVAACFSTPEFREALLTYTSADNPNDPFPPETCVHNDNGEAVDREKLLNTILNKNELVCGDVWGYGGLGGGTTFGINMIYMGPASFFFRNRVDMSGVNGGSHLVIHELGHCVGMGHSSSMAGGYASIGHYIFPNVYKQLLKEGRLPYQMDPFKGSNDYNPGESEDGNVDDDVVE